jgi:hypothetical protein
MMPQANGLSRGPDAGTLLVRALRTLGAAFDVRVDSIAGRPWASATFVGARYVVRLAAPSVPGVRSWFAALPGATFVLRGHIVADLCVDAVETIDDECRATLTVLTLQEA